MIYYFKKINEDNTVSCIITNKKTTEDWIEITLEEYIELTYVEDKEVEDVLPE